MYFHTNNKFVDLILNDLRKAKTMKEVFKLKCIWCNHVDESLDYLFRDAIPKHLKGGA